MEGEFKHYLRIITAVQKTIDVQKEIDAIYLDIEKKIGDMVKSQNTL